MVVEKIFKKTDKKTAVDDNRTDKQSLKVISRRADE